MLSYCTRPQRLADTMGSFSSKDHRPGKIQVVSVRETTLEIQGRRMSPKPKKTPLNKQKVEKSRNEAQPCSSQTDVTQPEVTDNLKAEDKKDARSPEATKTEPGRKEREERRRRRRRRLIQNSGGS